jgi:hypothetical protein
VSIESIDSVDYGFEEIEEVDESPDSFTSKSSTTGSSKKLDELFLSRIFAQNNKSTLSFAREANKKEILSAIDFKTQKIAQDNNIKITEFNYEVEGKLTFEFGGKDGTKYEGGVSGKASDDNGNHMEIKRDSDGNTSLSVSGGHSSDDSPESEK